VVAAPLNRVAFYAKPVWLAIAGSRQNQAFALKTNRRL
jgi:hypothetical protein